MDKPEIAKVSVKFCQDGNTMGTTDDYEDITIDLEYQLGEEDGSFVVIRTDGWSIDSVKDLENLIKRVKSIEKN